jgi:hypothetical protein
MTLPTYEVFAIKYAQRNAVRTNHFLGGDAHDVPMPMDYFVWLIRNDQRTYVLDVGFTAKVGAQRKREVLRSPAEGLAKLGVDSQGVKDVIVSHMHYDHIGTFADFGSAKFHLQDDEMAFVTGRHMCHPQLRHSFEVDDVCGVIRMIYEDRAQFHDGDDEIAPGLTVHRVGGHTMGLQFARVHTKLLRALRERPGLPDDLPYRRGARRLQAPLRTRRFPRPHRAGSRPDGDAALPRGLG